MAKFLIAGAGIAGLSAAIALLRTGHTVTIWEQAAELSEVGAGIQLGPNAMHILQSWGLGKALLELGCEPISLVVRDARNDHVLSTRRLDDAQTRYGAPYICIRRSDLQQVLLDAVMNAGVDLRLGQKFDAAFATGYDAVLGCDGLHSLVREQVLENTKHSGKPRASGHTAYRAMIDMAMLPMDLRAMNVQVWLDDKRHVVAYPVNHQQLNVVIAQEGMPTLAQPTSATLHTLIAAIDMQDGFSEWPLFDRPAMLHPKFYAKGYVALLGDAAHPMRPYLAQGAAMAIEDAQALGQAFTSQPNVDKALQAYAKARWRRNARVQWQSRLNGYVFHASGVVRVMRDAALRVTGERVTAMPWLYSYPSS